jgi:hypothetical protein
MKYPIPDSEDIEWQQDMLREIDCTLETIVDDFELEWMSGKISNGRNSDASSSVMKTKIRSRLSAAFLFRI